MEKRASMNPYYIYVTLHLLECRDDSLVDQALDTKWGLASEIYKEFLESKYNVETKSEYECIEEFIIHESPDY